MFVWPLFLRVFVILSFFLLSQTLILCSFPLLLLIPLLFYVRFLSRLYFFLLSSSLIVSSRFSSIFFLYLLILKHFVPPSYLLKFFSDIFPVPFFHAWYFFFFLFSSLPNICFLCLQCLSFVSLAHSFLPFYCTSIFKSLTFIRIIPFFITYSHSVFVLLYPYKFIFPFLYPFAFPFHSTCLFILLSEIPFNFIPLFLAIPIALFAWCSFFSQFPPYKLAYIFNP